MNARVLIFLEYNSESKPVNDGFRHQRKLWQETPPLLVILAGNKGGFLDSARLAIFKNFRLRRCFPLRNPHLYPQKAQKFSRLRRFSPLEIHINTPKSSIFSRLRRDFVPKNTLLAPQAKNFEISHAIQGGNALKMVHFSPKTAPVRRYRSPPPKYPGEPGPQIWPKPEIHQIQKSGLDEQGGGVLNTGGVSCHSFR